ncbi:peroxide stress protein YaaA [Pontibaca methylaminivorans]|uniref:peroxide stress protein YaaA n=1 Tax=Pontibaca methylaminivorans TaxID=515897 RepID=UPI002FDAE4DE
MLVVVSPAKKLDWSERDIATTQPAFLAEANELAGVARGLGVEDLRRLMKISDKLARLNHGRFRDFAPAPAPEDTRPAALAFAGDTYQGFDAASMDADEWHWAQDHLRILSGLYGLLRPLDAIQPYRLEMGSRLATARGKSLYDFWGDRLAKALTETAAALGTRVLVNCASEEYFRAADRDALGLDVVTPVFMEERDGKPVIISFHAKKARGAMARFIIRHRLDDPQALRDFDSGGYVWNAALSEPGRPVFLRAG